MLGVTANTMHARCKVRRMMNSLHIRQGNAVPAWICLVVTLILRSPEQVGLAAEPDPRMVPPPHAIRGKLPGIAPAPAPEAAKSFRVLDGFRMDLLAAEPPVASPVAMTYDENGRAYVCEMRDYPYTDKAHHHPDPEKPPGAPPRPPRPLAGTRA